MSSRKSTLIARRRENGRPSRWDQYRELVVQRRIPHKAHQYYVSHLKRFLGELRPSSLKNLPTDTISGYLMQIQPLRLHANLTGSFCTQI